MVIVEAIGTAVGFAFERWPTAALLALFTSPLWLSMGLQLFNHWSAS